MASTSASWPARKLKAPPMQNPMQPTCTPQTQCQAIIHAHTTANTGVDASVVLQCSILEHIHEELMMWTCLQYEPRSIETSKISGKGAYLGCSLLPKPLGCLLNLLYSLREVQVAHQLHTQKCQSQLCKGLSKCDMPDLLCCLRVVHIG